MKLGHVALDGTKIKANASKHKAMSYERMEKRAAELEAEVERWLSAEAADAEEDRAFGRDKSGEELPKWVADKKKRVEKIRARRRPNWRPRRREGRQRVGPRLPRPQYLEARPGADPVPGRTRNRLSFATSETVQRTMAAKLPPNLTSNRMRELSDWLERFKSHLAED